MQTKEGISSNTLKIIAIVSMVIDHLGAFLVLPLAIAIFGDNIDNEQVNNTILSMRIIGRLAFPIFCFLVTQGFLHTGNLKKYIIRMVAFAFISELPFDLIHGITSNTQGTLQLFNFSQQNIFFTLSLGILCLVVIKYFKQNNFIKLIVVICISAFAEFLNASYGAVGVLTIVMFYVFNNDKHKTAIITTWLGFSFYIFYVATSIATGMGLNQAVTMNVYQGAIQGLSAGSVAFISQYNGQRGRQLPKYLFYGFYPIHLLIIYFIVAFCRNTI